MWETRTNPQSRIADGRAREACNCLWLGAGGSGKTWAYKKVPRPLFQHFFGFAGFLAGAPTHAAVRLLGPEARTLHKLANVNPSMGLDRKQLRSQKGKNDSLEESLRTAQACVIDELSMTAPDVYHAVGYRFALQRREILGLDLERYLQQWLGAMPIGVQLGDFLQLRPATQKSLCEWNEAVSAISSADAVNEESESEAGQGDTNASELGRLLFKYSTQRVVYFTGTGRFSDCASGQQLVQLLSHMRQGSGSRSPRYCPSGALG